MLYKFKSKSCGDVIMLQANGQRMLEVIGKETANGASQKGIVVAAQIPAALAALEAEIAREKAAQTAALALALAKHEPAPRFEAISLRQRTVSFMAMLRQSAKDGHDIVWGV